MGGAALVLSAGVCPVCVVVVEVLCQVDSEAADFGDQIASESGFPAFFEDGLLDSFHTSIRLGAADSDEPMLPTELFDGVAEDLGAIPASRSWVMAARVAARCDVAATSCATLAGRSGTC